MEELFLSEKLITLYEILVIAGLILIIIRQAKKNKEICERRNISNEKMRNAKLDEMLKNPEINSDWPKQPNPFEVQYMQKAKTELAAIPKYQVEIEVHTETSVQRYLFDLDQEITIGRDEKNVLPLNDKQAVRKGCSIFSKDHAVYVKNQSSNNPVYIQRGKKKQMIQNQMVKLQSKDILTIGKTALHVSLYEN